MEDYLKRNGLYPSSTYFFLRTQPRYLSGDEFESNTSEATGKERALLPRKKVLYYIVLYLSKATYREVCKVHHCTVKKSQSCLRCEQNHEYEENLWANNTPWSTWQATDQEALEARMVMFDNWTSIPELKEFKGHIHPRA